MNNFGITSFCFFEKIKNIRIFFYEKLDYLKRNIEKLIIIFKKYKYIIMETTEPKELNLYNRLNSLNIYHSFFIFHHIDFVNLLPFRRKLKKNQIWSLGNFSIGTQVNPHYFGNFHFRKKNKITKFFITSTVKRKYQILIDAAEKIKNENLKFHVIVVGKTPTFSKRNISKKLKHNFTFKYNVTYSELYKEVYESDYIIINLNPDNKYDIQFTKIRVTGSAQLAYGFLKPVLIHKNFSKSYKFNSSNSFIYNNSDFIKNMKEAINLEDKDYQKLQEIMLFLSREIYMKSLNNIKFCLNNL